MIKINVVILLVVLCGCIVPSKEELTTGADHKSGYLLPALFRGTTCAF